MTPERAARLQEIGFDWVSQDPRHVPWEVRLSELSDYKLKYDTTCVPMGYKNNVQLSNWVSTQRQEYKLYRGGKPSRLTTTRVQTLNSIGFVWEAHHGPGSKAVKRKRTDSSSQLSNRHNTIAPHYSSSSRKFESTREPKVFIPNTLLLPGCTVLSHGGTVVADQECRAQDKVTMLTQQSFDPAQNIHFGMGGSSCQAHLNGLMSHQGAVQGNPGVIFPPLLVGRMSSMMGFTPDLYGALCMETHLQNYSLPLSPLPVMPFPSVAMNPMHSLLMLQAHEGFLKHQIRMHQQQFDYAEARLDMHAKKNVQSTRVLNPYLTIPISTSISHNGHIQATASIKSKEPKILSMDTRHSKRIKEHEYSNADELNEELFWAKATASGLVPCGFLVPTCTVTVKDLPSKDRKQHAPQPCAIQSSSSNPVPRNIYNHIGSESSSPTTISCRKKFLNRISSKKPTKEVLVQLKCQESTRGEWNPIEKRATVHDGMTTFHGSKVITSTVSKPQLLNVLLPTPSVVGDLSMFEDADENEAIAFIVSTHLDSKK